MSYRNRTDGDNFDESDRAEAGPTHRQRAVELVQSQAKNLSDIHEELEREITVVGRTLDDLKAAREIVQSALGGTEKMRSSFDMPVPKRSSDTPYAGQPGY